MSCKSPALCGKIRAGNPLGEPAGIRHILFGDRLCRMLCFCPFPSTFKTPFPDLRAYVRKSCIGLQFHIQLSFTSGHHVQKFPFIQLCQGNHLPTHRLPRSQTLHLPLFPASLSCDADASHSPQCQRHFSGHNRTALCICYALLYRIYPRRMVSRL